MCMYTCIYVTHIYVYMHTYIKIGRNEPLLLSEKNPLVRMKPKSVEFGSFFSCSPESSLDWFLFTQSAFQSNTTQVQPLDAQMKQSFRASGTVS